MRVTYGDGIGKEIPDWQVRFYDGILHIIYDETKYARVLLNAEVDDPVSLSDISKEYDFVEKVIFDEAFRGWVYAYGNHRPGQWELVGETCGYA